MRKSAKLHELVKEDLNFLKEMLELKNESMVVAYLAYYYLKNAAKVTLEEHKECCEYAKSLHEGKDMREWVIEKGLKKIHHEGRDVCLWVIDNKRSRGHL